MSEDSQCATRGVGMKNRSGTEGISIPQHPYEHLKAPSPVMLLRCTPRLGAPRSALALRKSSKADERGDGEVEGGHAAYVTCLLRGHFARNRSHHRPKECEHAPRATARGGGGGRKPGCLCLTVGSGFRAEVRMLQILTAAVCLQDLRNRTKQPKRNPVV